MNTTRSGREAEDMVAYKMRRKGHKIVAQNWRTRWCEIDIVSVYKKRVYFTEVKFRSNSIWGDGFEYITDKKLRQMNFAAEFWIAQERWNGEACMQAASVGVDGIIEFIELD